MGTTFFFLYILLSCACMYSCTVTAFCPSNGNTHVIYVTTNMGDNIWTFDTSGRYIGLALNMSSFPFHVDKLRDMKFGPGNHLYISSARGQYSRIFTVSGNGLLNGTLSRRCTRNYLFTATSQSSANPFLDHPYAMAFHPVDGSLYVANQNSVTITKYEQVNDGKSAYPQWRPVKNIEHAFPNASTLGKIPDKAGLFASSWSSEYTMLSVRGMALSPPLPRSLVEKASPSGYYSTERDLTYYIIVCDIAADQLLVFLADTGEYVFSLTVSSPVQVLFPSRYQKPMEKPISYFETPYIYVTSKEDGLTFLVPFVIPPQKGDILTVTNSQRRLTPYAITKRNPQHSTSGIYENPAHDVLLIADRGGRRISTYASPFLVNGEEGKEPSPFLGYFSSKLPDQPEFILTTMVEQQSAIPFCYELNEEGSFRYVALCAAGYIWALTLLGMCFIVTLVFLIRGVRHCQERCARSRRKQRKVSVDNTPENVPLVGTSNGDDYGTTQ